MRTSKSKMILVLLASFMSFYLAIPTFNQQCLHYVPDFFKSKPVNLGLDLKGGASILIEVEIQEYLQSHMNQYSDIILADLHKNHVNYVKFQPVKNGFSLSLAGGSLDDQVLKILKESIGQEFDVDQQKQQIDITLKAHISDEIADSLVTQSIEIVKRRVDELGTKEIDIQKQGKNAILLQVPGTRDPEEIKKLLGKTAKLSFHFVEEGVTMQNLATHPRRSSLRVAEIESDYFSKQKHHLVLQHRPIMTGDMLIDAKVSFNQNTPVISFKLDRVGTKIFADVSSNNIGSAIAILLDDKILSAPVIREPILGGVGVISGNFSISSANELALLLRSGSLPVPLKIVEERVVGPTLGSDSITAGLNAVIIGASMVSLFMVIFYGIFGIFANIALIINVFAIISCISIIGATLTLPGIAGIVLTLGMAVDANVLIYERIREELRNGKSNISAIDAGYRIAFTTILDANITSIICAFILYFLGSGSMKSFAISLIIGISCSMFTAVSLTRLVTDFWYWFFKPRKLYI